MLYIGIVFIMVSTLVIFSLCKIAGAESRIAEEENRIYGQCSCPTSKKMKSDQM